MHFIFGWTSGGFALSCKSCKYMWHASLGCAVHSSDAWCLFVCLQICVSLVEVVERFPKGLLCPSFPLLLLAVFLGCLFCLVREMGVNEQARRWLWKHPVWYPWELTHYSTPVPPTQGGLLPGRKEAELGGKTPQTTVATSVPLPFAGCSFSALVLCQHRLQDSIRVSIHERIEWRVEVDHPCPHIGSDTVLQRKKNEKISKHSGCLCSGKVATNWLTDKLKDFLFLRSDSLGFSFFPLVSRHEEICPLATLYSPLWLELLETGQWITGVTVPLLISFFTCWVTSVSLCVHPN